MESSVARKPLEVIYGKSKLTRQERLARIRELSQLAVTANTDSDGNLTAVTIELHGKLAAVPSLKNSKPNGANFMSTRARDWLTSAQGFWKAQSFLSSFGDEPLLAVIVWGKRPVRFDTDNATTTIKDWLEPATKIVGKFEKRSRGWGAGLVNNDSQVEAWPVRASQLGLDTTTTTIYLRPMRLMRETVAELLARVIMAG